MAKRTQPSNALIALISCLALLLIAACTSRVYSPPPSSHGKKGTFKPYTIQGQTYYPLDHARGFSQRGLASWYGHKFHGRRTANGEVYNMDAMTAAHKTLPMNTWVKVTNTNTGQSAVVRINDRGPFVRGRIIDLSRVGAKKVGVFGPGTAPVYVEALGYRQAGTGTAGKPAVYKKPASYQEGDFSVQVGAFTNPSNANRLAAKLRPTWGVVKVVVYDRGDMIFHRVRVGKARTLSAAESLETRLRSAGFHDAMAVAN